MIEGGIILLLVGAIAQVVAPAQDAIAYRRWLSTTGVGTDRTRDARIIAADTALARDPLIVAIAGITEIYRRG